MFRPKQFWHMVDVRVISIGSFMLQGAPDHQNPAANMHKIWAEKLFATLIAIKEGSSIHAPGTRTY